MFPSNNKLAKELSTKYPVIPNNPQDQIDTLNTKLDAHKAETTQEIENITVNNIPRLSLSFLAAPIGSRFSGNSETFLTFCTFYQVYSARDRSTGALYALENTHTGRTSQRVVCSIDGGHSWNILGEIPVDIANNERLTKLFVEPSQETFYVLKLVDYTQGTYNVLSYSYNASSSTFTLIGTLDIGKHQWLNSSRSIDSAYVSGLGTVTMFAEYGDDTEMRVWRTTDKGANWTAVLTKTAGSGSVGEIRHFHTCQVDPYTGTWWLSSGDADNQCFVWTSTDSGENWVLQGGGVNQETRLIGFVFESDYAYYAMDTPQDGVTTKIFRFEKDNFDGREVIGYQPENTAIRGITRTFFPAGFITWPAFESAGVSGQYVTPQFYDYATGKMQNLIRFDNRGKVTGGFYDAARYQCKWSGVIALQLYGDVADQYAYDQRPSTIFGSKFLKAQITN